MTDVKTDWKPDIFGYLDYREFLADYYEAAKANNRAFSYRYFSRRAGYSSPNFLKLVIMGERSLGAESVERFARALKLDGDETRFFRDLVAFNQAKTSEDKSAAFERVGASQRFRSARRLDSAYFTYLSRWYYPAIREMAARKDFRADPEWIAAQLLPPIRPSEAREALDVLFELGLLVRAPDGSLRRGEASLTTGHEVRSLAIGNYHRQMLTRAGESIELVAREQRDLSALTVCIAADTAAELKDRIHEFRERLLDRCDRDLEPNVVYQLNIQLFPLTAPPPVPEDDLNE